MSKQKKICIVGLGLIGGSYAEGLSKKGYEIYAIDNNQSSIDFAKDRKWIVDGTVDVTKEYISQFLYFVFALYPTTFLSWMRQYHDCFQEQSIFTDVSGVKENIVVEIQELIKEQTVEFIPSHPMAGREVYGVQNADSHIFQGANFIITPTNKNTQKGISFCEEIGNALGFRAVSILSIQEHDEMIAFLSQLTHCIAVSLMTCKESHHLVDYTGDSFRDLTRIANINEKLWTELFLENKEKLIHEIDLFSSQLQCLRNAIQKEDTKTLHHMMKESTLHRSYFDKLNE